MTVVLGLKDIPDDEVERDIADMEREIAVLENELRGLRFAITSKEQGVRDCREFVIALREMLAIRRGEA